MSELALDLYNALSEIVKLRARIAELEALVEVSEGLYKRIYEQEVLIAELEADNNRLKCSNDTQTDSVVYGKDSKEESER